jgi:hypothetical protein
LPASAFGLVLSFVAGGNAEHTCDEAGAMPETLAPRSIFLTEVLTPPLDRDGHSQKTIKGL